jgi:hypothetical protein
MSFDPARCASFYNRIIRISFDGNRRAERGDRIIQDWFSVWQDHPRMRECRQIFPEPFIAFLKQVEVIVDQNNRPRMRDALVQHLEPISSPELMLALGPGSVWMEIDDCVLLFRNNLYGLTDCAGVVMDLHDLTVCYLPSIYYFDTANIEANPWYPLQDLLERLNAIIEVRKYRPVPFRSVQNDPLSANIACWDVVPWNNFILKQSLEAYDALLEAITSRLPSAGEQQQQQQQQQQFLATDESIGSHIQGFPRAFLLAAAKPSFQFIAPGLTVYDVNCPPPQPKTASTADRYDSPCHEMCYTRAFHHPLILFPAMGHIEKEAGLWICPDEGWADTVKLVLPYELRSYPDHSGQQVTDRPSATELWQQGDCPFYVPHSTRLATMLNQWRVLVEEGIWTIGADGVERGVDFYHQAEEADKIEWFCLIDNCFDLSEVDIDP